MTMSPSDFTNHDHKQQKVTSQRSSALNINKNSHLIHKAPSPLKISTNKQQRQPLIIYTHSPKIIHTEARHFMALVQKLTGMSPRPSNSAKHPPLKVEQHLNDTPKASYHFADVTLGSDNIRPKSFISDAPLSASGSHYRYPFVTGSTRNGDQIEYSNFRLF